MSDASRWRRLLGDTRAITTVEYALIGSLIFIIIVAAISQLGGNLQTTFGGFANNL